MTLTAFLFNSHKFSPSLRPCPCNVYGRCSRQEVKSISQSRLACDLLWTMRYQHDDAHAGLKITCSLGLALLLHLSPWEHHVNKPKLAGWRIRGHVEESRGTLANSQPITRLGNEAIWNLPASQLTWQLTADTWGSPVKASRRIA